MGTKKSKEFLEIIHRFQKIISKARPIHFIPHGEFIMLSAIEKVTLDNESSGKAVPLATVSQLANQLKSSKSATSKMLKVIEEKNYIERAMDQTDRRIVYVKITNSGQDILCEAKREMEMFSDNIMEKMGEKDSEELIRLMNKLQIIVENELSKKG